MASALVKKLNAVLGAELREFRSGLETGPANSRAFGFVVSADFSGLDHGRRQRRLRAILDRSLTESELARVGPIATLTPAEADIGDTAA